MKIKILVTGGTFDKEHDPISEKLIFKKTHVPKILKQARSLLKTKVDVMMLMDSSEIRKGDRELILKACQDAKEDRIVITHGTSTMEKTAQFLGKRIKDKTIVLTGAMVPYTLRASDALFNIGSALAFVQMLPHGIYICMNGRYYEWGNVRKNEKLGVFEKRK